jgi:hypothetical protein
MHRRAEILAVLIALVAVGSPAAAISPTCFLPSLPSVPLSSAVSVDASWGNTGTFRVEVWRQPCEDGSGVLALLLRATPIVGSPTLCASNFLITQGGQQIEVGLAQTATGDTFCTSDLLLPTTFSLERHDGPPFDTDEAFRLIVKAGGADPAVTLDVPPADPAQFGLAVVATGCSVCPVRQRAKFELRITNPGPPFAGELKTVVKFPTGAVVTVLGRYVEQKIQTGAHTISLFDLEVPANVPKGTYTIEAAILDPDTGVTLVRDSRQALVP